MHYAKLAFCAGKHGFKGFAKSGEIIMARN
jgi:hypothetical protein